MDWLAQRKKIEGRVGKQTRHLLSSRSKSASALRKRAGLGLDLVERRSFRHSPQRPPANRRARERESRDGMRDEEA